MTGASTTTATMRQRWQAVMMNNYGTPPIALASGDGAVVTDVDGRTYIDLLGGIAVNVLGHRHPAVIEAVTRQMSTLGHTSNLYATEPGIALAEELVALLGADQRTRVFFCNSGAEANEAAFKLSRLTGRTKLVAAHDAFHETALFGSDPNWGRVLAAVGMAPITLDPDRISVSFNGAAVCVHGVGAPGAREVDLSDADIDITVDLGVGDGQARIRTTDLSHAYVEENSAYSS